VPVTGNDAAHAQVWYPVVIGCLNHILNKINNNLLAVAGNCRIGS
jgi:hypothetical protein